MTSRGHHPPSLATTTKKILPLTVATGAASHSITPTHPRRRSVPDPSHFTPQRRSRDRERDGGGFYHPNLTRPGMTRQSLQVAAKSCGCRRHTTPIQTHTHYAIISSCIMHEDYFILVLVGGRAKGNKVLIN